MAAVKGYGHEVGFMNFRLSTFFQGTRWNDIPRVSGAYRFFWGWWLWRTGAEFMGDEFYGITAYGQPYNPFDGTLAEPHLNDYSGVVSPSPTGPRPHTHYEWMREGRDDMRYLSLLGRLIAEARETGSPQSIRTATEAQAFLDGVAGSVNIEEYQGWAGAADSPWWTFEQYDQRRREVAEHIVKLARCMAAPE